MYNKGAEVLVDGAFSVPGRAVLIPGPSLPPFCHTPLPVCSLWWRDCGCPFQTGNCWALPMVDVRWTSDKQKGMIRHQPWVEELD